MLVQPLARNRRLSYLTLGSSSGASSSKSSLTPAAEPIQHDQHSIPVTGPPSRQHWKADWKATYCEHFDCRIWFGLFDRRHHCRRCGNIFCAQHCSNYFRLDQACQFHPGGILSRGCDTCTSDYLIWTKDERSLYSKQPTTTSSSFTMLPPPTLTPTQTSSSTSSLLKKSSVPKWHLGIMTHQSKALECMMHLGVEDIATPVIEPPSTKHISINSDHKDKYKHATVFSRISSVPADWQWSTF